MVTSGSEKYKNLTVVAETAFGESLGPVDKFCVFAFGRNLAQIMDSQNLIL